MNSQSNNNFCPTLISLAVITAVSLYGCGGGGDSSPPPAPPLPPIVVPVDPPPVTTPTDPCSTPSDTVKALEEKNAATPITQILIKPTKGSNVSDIVKGNGRLKRILSDGTAVVELNSTVPFSEAQTIIDKFKKDGRVLTAEPDASAHASYVPTNNLYSSQWYLGGPNNINPSSAWDTTFGVGVTVAVLDTGYRLHWNFSNNLLPGYSFISDPVRSNNGIGRSSDATDPGDWLTKDEVMTQGSPFYGCAAGAVNSSWHGTRVTGLIAAQGSAGIFGIASQSKILPVRVLGKCGGTTSDIADAMRWAAGIHVDGVPDNTNPAKVLNLSLGSFGKCSATYQAAVNDVVARGVSIVVAAGNDGIDVSMSQPASCQGVISVGASDQNGARPYFSNYGGVTLSAPGVNVISTANDGLTVPQNDVHSGDSGTSFAAPMVSATIALMLSKNPLLTPTQIAAILKSTARKVTTNTSTCKSYDTNILDVSKAVAYSTQ